MGFNTSLFSGKKKVRVTAAALAALFCLAIVYLWAGRYRAISTMTAVKKEEYAKFKSLEEEYLKKKALLDARARKAYASDAAESAITAIERIGTRAGVKELVTSLKPIEEKETAGYVERSVEVRIERIDINQLVNLLYLMENNRGLFVIREFSMKNRFEDPDLLDVSLKVVHLVKPKA